MAFRNRNSPNAISLRKPRHARRRLRGRASARFLILLVLGVGLAVGTYVKHEEAAQIWLTGAGSQSANDPSDQPLPRALRGGNAMQRTGNARTGHMVTTGISTGGLVTHIRDGDTIEVSGRPIRIAALDCAERGSTAGDAATRRMTALVLGQRVSCSLTGKRSYDRWIGSCRLPDGRDIASILIGEGACRRWR